MADRYIYRPRRTAGMRMWCGFCQDWFPIDDDWDGSCPRCGMVLSEYRCTRCGHTWVPKSNVRRHGLPASCPRCKSPYWNRERMRDPVTGEWYEGAGPKARYEEMKRQRDEYEAKRSKARQSKESKQSEGGE